MIPDTSDEKSAVFIIFGITGDLAQRYILPALYDLYDQKLLPSEFRLIGVSRRNVSLDDVYAKLSGFVGSDFDEAVAAQLKDLTDMRQMDLNDPAAYQQLLSDTGTLKAEFTLPVQRLYYLSVPPNAFLPMVKLMGETGHAEQLENENDLPRLLIEKPFGHDLASGHELIDAIAGHFNEAQTYRIDHYVAKRMVQDIVQMRFNNPQFSELWQSANIRSVQVVAHEAIDIEGRADFYEQTGALRDLIQSHLLQVLALSIMDTPAIEGSDAQHAARLQALQAIEPVDDLAQQTARGQYAGYRDEAGKPDSNNETYALLRLNSTAKQWKDTTLMLETGKALAERLAYVELTFTEPADFAGHQISSLRFRIQPDPAVVAVVILEDGSREELTIVPDVDDNASIPLDGYARVLNDALNGDHTTFSTAAEIIRSWEIVQPVLDGWHKNEVELLSYEKGTTPNV